EGGRPPEVNEKISSLGVDDRDARPWPHGNRDIGPTRDVVQENRGEPDRGRGNEENRQEAPVPTEQIRQSVWLADDDPGYDDREEAISPEDAVAQGVQPVRRQV